MVFIFIIDDIKYKLEQKSKVYGMKKWLSRGTALKATKKWNIPVHNANLLYGYCDSSRCYGVPYRIHNKYTLEQRNVILRAMEEIESDTCVR